jgi:hypothetical protein
VILEVPLDLPALEPAKLPIMPDGSDMVWSHRSRAPQTRCDLSVVHYRSSNFHSATTYQSVSSLTFCQGFVGVSVSKILSFSLSQSALSLVAVRFSAGGGVAWLSVAEHHVTSSVHTTHAIGELWPRTVCRVQKRVSRHVVLHVVRELCHAVFLLMFADHADRIMRGTRPGFDGKLG